MIPRKEKEEKRKILTVITKPNRVMYAFSVLRISVTIALRFFNFSSLEKREKNREINDTCKDIPPILLKNNKTKVVSMRTLMCT